MAEYRNIPVDEETYQMILALCDANDRKQGAQVKALAKPAYEQLMQEGRGKKTESKASKVEKAG